MSIGTLIFEKINAMALAAARSVSDKRIVQGIAVYLSAPDGADVEEQFSKVAGGLSLLEKADPIRFQRFKTAFASILVFETDNSNAAEAHLRKNICLVNSLFLASPRTDPVRLAAVFAHEGTHAWIEAAGVQNREALRPRIEGVCMSAEAAFLRRLPIWPAELGKALYARRNMPATYWADESIRDRVAKALQEKGVSPRIIGFFRRMGGRKGRNGA